MPSVNEGDRIRIHYPAHEGKLGTVTKVVERKDKPALIRVQIDEGDGFICDETMVEEINNGS